MSSYKVKLCQISTCDYYDKIVSDEQPECFICNSIMCEECVKDCKEYSKNTQEIYCINCIEEHQCGLCQNVYKLNLRTCDGCNMHICKECSVLNIDIYSDEEEYDDHETSCRKRISFCKEHVHKSNKFFLWLLSQTVYSNDINAAKDAFILEYN